jgi:signal transduction histidine kinase
MKTDPAPEQVLLLRGDGSVAAVSNAPAEWVDRSITDLPLPPATRPAVTLIVHDSVPLRRTAFRISALVMRILDVFASQAKSARVLFDVVQADEIPPVLYGDEEKVAWALATLVGNALRIVSQPARDDVDPFVQLRIGWLAGQNIFVFTVSDNGPGMSDATARWLFDRDPRTGKPVGLALLMVRDIVAAHRGSVRVESEIGVGTQFHLLVPRGHPE